MARVHLNPHGCELEGKRIENNYDFKCNYVYSVEDREDKGHGRTVKTRENLINVDQVLKDSGVKLCVLSSSLLLLLNGSSYLDQSPGENNARKLSK